MSPIHKNTAENREQDEEQRRNTPDSEQSKTGKNASRTSKAEPAGMRLATVISSAFATSVADSLILW